jgi:putative transposase
VAEGQARFTRGAWVEFDALRDKELLGLWVGESEGAKFWLSVLTELKNRGVQDILIAAVDGLKGLPDAIEAVFPKTQGQLCIVHLIRGSLRYVSWKERKAVVRDLKTIYQAPSLEAATDALEAFSVHWDGRFPQISRMWRVHWTNLTPFFDYPPAIRKVIYTTNAVESVNGPATQGDEAPGRLSDPRLREEGVVLGHHESE